MSSGDKISIKCVVRSSLLVCLLAILSACSGLPPTEIPKPPHAGADVVIFDIDGTLTPRVRSINSARPHASEAVRAYSDHGYTVVYLSARRPMFQHGIPGWLRRNRFPEGALHLPQNDTDRDDPAAFKQRILDAYVARGWHLGVAFGDSSSDFEAYANAGIPQNRVFALRREGASACEPGHWKRCLAELGGNLPLLGGPSD